MPSEIEKAAVANLQRYLRTLYYFDDALSPTPVDGVFDRATEEAVRRFQREEDLAATGRVDQITWERLFAEYEKRKREEDRRVSPDFFPQNPADYETTLGERNAFISLLQFVLEELRVVYDTLPPFPQNGVFDAESSAAVREFQRIGGLPQSGRVNRNVWNRLAEEYGFYAN